MRIFMIVLLLSAAVTAFAGEKKQVTVVSPDGRTAAIVETTGVLRISVIHAGVVMIPPSRIGLSANGGDLCKDPAVRKTTRKEVRDTLVPVVPSYSSRIPDRYNEAVIDFSGSFSLAVRVYDDGAAYRFMTKLPGTVKFSGETLMLACGPEDSIWFPEETSFLTHSERLYKYQPVYETAPGHFCSLPALLVKPNGWKVAVTEADIENYPGMYLSGTGDTILRAVFPHYPLEEKQTRDRTIIVEKAADYLVECGGTRTFPWRVFGIAEQDADLIGKELVYRLGPPLQLADVSWIRPGKVAWDWWNALNIYGVDFRAGVNTSTYKYFIDFAAKYGIEYIILDEGWSDPADLFNINPEMDMEEIFRYAGEKKVGVIPWVVWCTLDRQLDSALAQFSKWGAAGIKVDFMQRDDAVMVNYYWKIARRAAEHHLLVDFHGSYKPDGLRRAYPNVLTREGVKGLENTKWSEDVTPIHCLTLPFIRMYAGPMDFTPGAMVNGARFNFKPLWFQPMSMGTRCQQLAMYVLYDSPLQMLSDNPSNYMKEPEIMEFLSAVPVTWEETRVSGAAIAKYLYMVRKKGEDWYIGGMTDWNARSFTQDFDFLGTGEYELTLYRDGVNADRNGNDFRMERKRIRRGDQVQIQLAPGGGFAGIIKPLDSIKN